MAPDEPEVGIVSTKETAAFEGETDAAADLVLAAKPNKDDELSICTPTVCPTRLARYTPLLLALRPPLASLLQHTLSSS